MTALVVAGLFVAACVSESGSSNDCEAAFRSAQASIGEAPLNVSPLDDAVRTCRSVAEWTAAWHAVPRAHPTGLDPIAFLRGRCADPSLAETALCDEVLRGA